MTRNLLCGALVMTVLALPAIQGQTDDPRIQQGLTIAPVKLSMTGLDPNLVGLGSYFVNAVGDCNGCHTSGGPPNFNYAAGANPYFGQPAKTDPAVYLGGGSDFFTALPPDSPTSYAGPDIIARNLTPDKTGMPAGGHTWAEFLQIIRTGADLDHLHPTCVVVSPVPTPANCIPPPVKGEVLQVMPWPAFAKMSDHDLLAIYTYLSAIPCITGPTDPANPLHNDCGIPPGSVITIQVNGPAGSSSGNNAFTTSSNQFSLDASQTKSSNAGPVNYSWALSPGYPTAGVLGANTAKPTFQLSSHGTYQFALTVTDAVGFMVASNITVQY